MNALALAVSALRAAPVPHLVTFRRPFYRSKPETRRFGSLERAREVARALRAKGYRVETPRPVEVKP